jgi:alpha-1,6-mannosyltransferase
MANYPGGEALSLLNQKYAAKDHGIFSYSITMPDQCTEIYMRGPLTVHVHISNLAAQTGASLFLHTHSPPYTDIIPSPSSSHWIYNKTESLLHSTLASASQITHLIVESDADQRFYMNSGKWELVDSILAFDGWKIPTGDTIRKIGKGMDEMDFWLLVPSMEKKEKLWIMQRTVRQGNDYVPM